MTKNKKNRKMNHDEAPPHWEDMRRMHPFMHRRPMMGGSRRPHMQRMRMFPGFRIRQFIGEKLSRGPMMMFDDIDSKAEAIEVMELQIKQLQKHKNLTAKHMERHDLLEKHMEETISEIGGMKEFSNEELRKILRRGHRKFQMDSLDEEEY